MAALAASSFRCVHPCTKAFSTQRGLTKHQDTCTIYSDVTGAELFEFAQMEESAVKRRRVDAHYNMRTQDSPLQDVQMVQGAVAEPPWHDASQDMSQCDPNTRMATPAPTDELGRGKRRKWRTRRYMDPRPEPPAPLPDPEPLRPADVAVQPVTFIVPATCKTLRNANGLFREYASRPTFVPDEWSYDDVHLAFEGDEQTPEDDQIQVHAESQTSRFSVLAATSVCGTHPDTSSWFAPFLSATAFRLMNWFWGSAALKSISDLQSLADNVLKADDFLKNDLARFNAGLENKRLDRWIAAMDALTSDEYAHDGWNHASVHIELPTRTRHSPESPTPRFEVSGLHYRPIVEVIKAAFTTKAALRFHLTPYKHFWQRNENEAPERVYDEMYTANAWLRLHADLQERPRNSNDEYERVIAGLMFWSDSTHLTNFGSASLWPLYMYFGNQSKHERSKPSSHSCYHIAYFPKLPDGITDAFKKINYGKLPTQETLTHCKRDLMHALLTKIFDEGFKTACKEGLVIKCFDGITRRVFPRIMTYSADYPEKALLASIKFLSANPCPRCLISKSETHRLGSKRNQSIVQNQPRLDSHSQQTSIANARAFIYREGRGVKCLAVEAVLAPTSLVPTLNAFSNAMFCLGYNFYSIFVVDFLHEIELGLWKFIFIHLIRILAVCGQDAVMLLNERYRLIDTFGPDTIRKFTNDAASMKRMAARDYEDLLLCSAPVFEGLFPPDHDAIVQRLLSSVSTWHALAKLRVHTDRTVQLLEKAKQEMSKALQRFQIVTCQAYETRELPSERARREKREARNLSRKAANPVPQTVMPGQAQEIDDHPPESQAKSGPRPGKKGKGKRKGKGTQVLTEERGSKRKRLNLNTYKAHAPDHYVHDIQEFGSLDSYSTQIGELEHRAVKRYYSRTNKRQAEVQITRIQRREHALRQIAARDPSVISDQQGTSPSIYNTCSVSRSNEEHHRISNSRSDSIYLKTWLRNNIYDPAIKGFQRKLKNHFLERLLENSWDEDASMDFTDSDRNTVAIEYNRLYVHKIFRVRYTTYDGQRHQDSMNPRTRSDVMLLRQYEDEDDNRHDSHPYRYAQIIGIFHAVVRHKGPRSTTEDVPVKMEVLWVRWYELTCIPSTVSPSNRLDVLTFVPSDSDKDAFGFLNPNDVVRGIHLIPAFAHGKTDSLLCSSIARKLSEENKDWKYYYINRFVDRDMYMRYVGGGIGHSLLRLRNCALETSMLDNESEAEHEAPDDPSTQWPHHETERRVLYDLHNDEVCSIDEDREDDAGSASEEEEG